MLRELTIRQFAIIEHVHLRFDRGFHVLTGETGAGKSILIDALGLVAGGRASSEFVRHGADRAEIEAIFEIPDEHRVRQLLIDWGYEPDDLDQLIIRREITAAGKSTCRINGRSVTLSMLREAGRHLLDLSGQHEHQTLLRTEEHLEWLDRYGGDELLAIRKKYGELYAEYRELVRKLEELDLDGKEHAQRLDLLTFQRDEIAGAHLVPGEDEELERERTRLLHAEKLLSHTAGAYEMMYGERGALDLLQESLGRLEQAAGMDESLDQVVESARQAVYLLEEAVREVGRYRDGLEHEPGRLEQVEERLHLIRQLKRKYGNTIEEILSHQERVERELAELEHREESQEELRAEIESLEEELGRLAGELTTLRKKAAMDLEKRVERELADLHMGSTVFHVSFFRDAWRSGELTPAGRDRIEFMLSPNPGEPLKPLSRIASGGELSRILLALKVIFTGVQEVHTLIFDEIDTGVSGRAAQAIAGKIAQLGQRFQVLCVTHLPQVACMADHHFLISKETVNDSTTTRVNQLDESGRTQELARMLGGVEVTRTTLEHAEEMIRLAEEAKDAIRSNGKSG
ncbi:DNA repair protein RecN [Staphylospora marina]|uniref:DNA repair protein RecN n=1 Tax=Staphylospora marina TaxID=2490858 RepID=UPI000F5B99B2|nr:DNA repair protein RecN [Staphylospora marina]